MTRSSKLLAIATAALISLSGLTACSKDQTVGQDAVNTQGGSFEFYSPGGQLVINYPIEERKPIKDFSGPDLMDENHEIHLSDFKNQVVVLNAWGQWCAPCRTESDDLQEVHEKIQPQGGTVLGINVRDFNPQISRDFHNDNGLTYPSIYDPPFRTAASLGGVPSSVVPSTIVLDRQHRPAAVFLRAITANELMETVQKILDEEPQAKSS